MEKFQETNEGICLNIKVIPKSSRSEVIGWENQELKIRVAGIPEKGNANRELLEYLAKILSLGKSKIQLIKGEASRHKRVCIKDLTLEQIQNKIENILKKD